MSGSTKAVSAPGELTYEGSFGASNGYQKRSEQLSKQDQTIFIVNSYANVYKARLSTSMSKVCNIFLKLYRTKIKVAVFLNIISSSMHLLLCMIIMLAFICIYSLFMAVVYGLTVL